MKSTRTADFKLEKMSPLFYGFTILMFVLPLAFLSGGLLSKNPIMFFLALVFGLSHLGIWSWFRPRLFQISDSKLRILWPLRRLSFELQNISSAYIIDREEFKNRFGTGVRIGAGGLWGAFGQFVTPKQSFKLYVSRFDQFVIVEFRDQSPLMITPEKSKDFVTRLNAFTQS